MSLTIKERKELRNKLLLDLYEHHFSHNGAPFRTTRDELKANTEAELAYKYLETKNLIELERQGNQFSLFTLTAYGIDLAEEIHPKRNEVSKKDKDQQTQPDNTASAFMQW